MEEYGPIQIMVVGFEEVEHFHGDVLAELTRLKDRDLIRLIDLVVVAKDDDGDVLGVELSDLSEEQRAELGALAGALVGLGMEADEESMEAAVLAGAEVAEGHELADEAMWSIADTIPMGKTAAVALIEHRWAIPLRNAIRAAGGVPLADTWLHPDDLVAFGATMTAEG
jgi:uncharacterized membrane protein